MQIYIHRTACMHQLVTAVAQGYHWHVSGVVKHDKAVRFAEKVVAAHCPVLTYQQKWWSKKQGRANAHFFLHPTYRERTFQWWLVLTDGDHPARAQFSDWRDARESRQRIKLGDQFEALPQPRKNDRARWTWQCTDSYMVELRRQVLDAIRHRQDQKQLLGVFTAIHSMPGFRLIRLQTDQLRAFAKAQWTRTKAGAPDFKLPPRPLAVRYQNYAMVDLPVVVERLEQGLAPYSEEMRAQGRRIAFKRNGDDDAE